MLRERDGEATGNLGTAGRAGENLTRPQQHFTRKDHEVGNAGIVLVFSGDEGFDAALGLDRILPVDADAATRQHGWRHHKPDLLDLSQPLFVDGELERYPVTGHRYTNPTGSKRDALTS